LNAVFVPCKNRGYGCKQGIAQGRQLTRLHPCLMRPCQSFFLAFNFHFIPELHALLGHEFGRIRILGTSAPGRTENKGPLRCMSRGVLLCACGFNRSVQHLTSNQRERDVANEEVP
jgi:hypothetical protein